MHYYWNLTQHLKRKGWTNPNQFAEGSGVTYPVARRIFLDIEQGRPLLRIDTVTLNVLRRAFGVKNGLSLLRQDD